MSLSDEDFKIAREQCLKAVGYCRGKFKLRTISIRDLYQQAWIGIHKAVTKYDNTKGSKETFFYVWAKGELRNYIRSRSNNILSYATSEPTLDFARLELESSNTNRLPDDSLFTSVKNNLTALFNDRDIRKAIQCYKNGQEHPILDYLNVMVNLNPKPLRKRSVVLVDFSVISWTIYYRIIAMVDEKSPQLINLFKNSWRDEYIRIRKVFPDHQIVVGLDRRNDNNEYWRHEYLPDYKGGRKEKTQTYLQCYEIGKFIAEELCLATYELDGLEFDDTAAIFARLQRETKALQSLVLYTIDSDLLQLVNDECNIQYYTPRKPKSNEKIQSQLRTEKEVLEYADHHYRKKIDSPRDIADRKASTGEKTDNIPRGIQYLPLIDLHECWITGVKYLDNYKQQIKQEFFNANTDGAKETETVKELCRSTSC